jgi:ferric enterobactin receptor
MNAYRSFLFLFLLACTGSSALAQPGQSVALLGTVTNSLTKEPMANVNVFVVETRKGTQTDRDGFYLLTLRPGAYQVKVSYLGYKPIYRDVVLRQGETRVTFELEEDTRLLEEVTVTTGKAEENVQRVEIGASRLNIRSIQRIPAFMGEVDVMRSLLMLPGVTTVGEGTSGINVRGGSIDQNLVLMDDAPLFNTSHLFGFFSVFNQDAVRDVTLNRGGIPAQYGGRASSVLDVRLKYPNSEKFTGSGGIGLVASRLALEGPLVKGKLSTMLAVRASFNDFLFRLGPANLRGTKANFYDITNKWYWKIGLRDELTFTGYYSDDNFKIPSDSLSNVEVNASSSLYGYSTRSGTLRWQRTLRDNVSWEAVGVMSRYSASITIPDPANALDLVSGIDYANARVQYTNRAGDRHKFLVGASVVSYGIQPNTLTPGPVSNVLPVTLEQERSLESAVYLEDEWKLTERLSVVAGLRYSQFVRLGAASVYRYTPGLPRSEDAITEVDTYGAGEVVQTYGGLEPRLAVRWTLNENTSVKMGYNRMIQYLHLISNTTSALPTARWAASSTYLRPQVADQVSVGLFKNLKNNLYETSAEVYYKKLQDAIDYRDGADIVLNRALETAVLQGEGRAYGLELMGKKNTGFWTGWLSYTYARTFLQIDGDYREERINRGRWYPANFDRPHTLNAMAVYRPSVTTTVAFNFTFSSGRPGTFPQGRYLLYEPSIFGANVPIYTDRNLGRIPNYHRLDFSITFDEHPDKHPDRRWKGSWVFSLYNVYAHKNAFSVFYNIKPYTLATAYKLSIFGTVFPSLTYNFKF